MGELLRKIRRKLSYHNLAGNNNTRNSLLIAEPLETRILLSGYGDDHGDYYWEATLIGVGGGRNAYIEQWSDEDCFKFYAQEGKTYNVQVAEWEFDDASLYLLNKNGYSIIESDYTSGLGDTPRIVWTAPSSGYYYLEVSSYYYGTGKYGLCISEGNADWTFMMYIAGDNNLEPFIGSDFNEICSGVMASGGLTPAVNITIQTDGWEEGPYSGIFWKDSTYRYLIGPGYYYEDIYERNMGDPYTLIDFVNWSIEEYPADNYALVLWDHGGGFTGACSEQGAYGSSWDILTMQDFTIAANGFDEHLDIIGFDACLMGMTEVAYQFKIAADIFVASEPNEPATGWEYENIMNSLFSNPSIGDKELSECIVNSYEDEYKNEPLQLEALSATNLNIIDGLADAINIFAGFMLEQASPNNWLEVRLARQAAIEIDPNNNPLYSDFCDLGQFMQEIVDVSQSEVLQALAVDVINKLSEAIMYEWHDQNLEGVTGLMIYIPDPGTQIHADYNQDIIFLQDTKWDEFLNIFIIPPPPILTLKLKENSDSNIIGDGITNISQAHFEGNTSPNLEVWLDTNNDGHYEYGPYTANSQGQYGFYYTFDLPDKTYIYSVRTEDEWGQEGFATLVFTIDTQITSPVLNNISENNATSDTRPLISGTAEPLIHVTIFLNDTEVGIAQADEYGVWTYELPIQADGTIYIKALTTDIAGNISEFCQPLEIYIDTKPPGYPGNPKLTLSSDTGASQTDSITSDRTPTFTWLSSTDNLNGSGIAGYQWRIDDGNWSNWQTELFATTGILTDGAHTFYVWAKDYAGNIGPESRLVFTIDTQVDPPTIDSITPDTGASNRDFLTNSTHIIISGYAETGGSVQIYKSSVPLGPPVMVSNGAFSLSLPALTPGVHYLTAKVTDIAGNEAESLQPASVTIDTAPPRVADISPDVRETSAPVTELFVLFNEKLVPTSAADISNYTLKGSEGDYDFTNGYLPIVINDVSYHDLTRTVTISVNDGLPLPRDYYQLTINGTNSVTDMAGNKLDGDNNAIAGGDYIHEFWVGSLPVRIPPKGLRFYDADQTLVTIKFTGGIADAWISGENVYKVVTSKGTEVYGANAAIDNINILFQYSDQSTKLTITAKGGDNQADLGGITGPSLGILSAKTVDLVGDIRLTGSLGSMVLDDISNGASIITATATAKGFKFKADQIGQNVTFGIADSISSFQVNSDLQGVMICARDNVKKLSTNGAIIDSFVLAGYDMNVGGMPGLGSGDIGSISAKGIFQDSYISAGVLPPAPQLQEVLPNVLPPYIGLGYTGNIGKVKFGAIDLNATHDFGLWAASEIDQVKAGKLKFTATDPQRHFCVEENLG